MILDEIIERYRQDIIDHTVELVKIKSVLADAQPNMPFGEGINDALQYVLNLGSKLGFKAVNLDGYAGYIEYGKGSDLIGILVHLDVVPEGKGWTFPPFGATIHKNRIYGRGAIDDKSPAIASIFALKALMESGQDIDKRIRIIFGTNEENDWEGINYYIENEEIPSCAIVPDGDFPVINAEKGILSVRLSAREKTIFDTEIIKSINIKGGTRDNMVPDFCKCEIEMMKDCHVEQLLHKFDLFIEQTGYDMKFERDDNKAAIISHGISAHASIPEEGKNAVMQLIMFLSALKPCIKSKFVNFIADKIGMDNHGTLIGLDLQDEISGNLTLNPALIDLDDDRAILTINIRYPVTYSKDEILMRLLDATQAYNIDIETTSHMKSHYVPEDSILVKTLVDVYNSSMNSKLTPLSTGGGTYARALENAVAFGPSFPHTPKLAHQKDEYVDIDDLIKSCKIYVRALHKLCKQ
ncbi:MAG: dipeptidase PepV [Clostridia bacterium]|nr:dipeptidase PepV [Clostridia bacterium]